MHSSTEVAVASRGGNIEGRFMTAGKADFAAGK